MLYLSLFLCNNILDQIDTSDTILFDLFLYIFFPIRIKSKVNCLPQSEEVLVILQFILQSLTAKKN
jgi:hypothetical protein